MIYVAFVPLLAAWAVLHRAARGREWGFVGWPTFYREWGRKLARSNRELESALRRVTAAAHVARLALRASALTRALQEAGRRP